MFALIKRHPILFLLLFILLIWGCCVGVFRPTIHFPVKKEAIDYIVINSTGGCHTIRDEEIIRDTLSFLENIRLAKGKEEDTGTLWDNIEIYYKTGEKQIYRFGYMNAEHNQNIYEAKFPKVSFYEKMEIFLLEHGLISFEEAQFINKIRYKPSDF